MTRSDWTDATLGEIAEIVSGATPKTSEASFWDGGVPWATPRDLSDLESAEISATARTISKAGLNSCGARLLPANSVLLSSRAPIGHVAINRVPMATNQGFKSLVPDESRVEARFLYWWLKRNRPLLESLGNGATFKEISKAVTAAIPIRLPPLDEQRRLAEVLDTAALLQAKQKDAIAEIDAFTRGAFINMFGDPAMPGEIPKAPIGHIATVVTGNTPPRSVDENYGSHIEWLKSDNILESGMIAPAAEHLSEVGRKRGREAPAGSSLVVCIAGSPRSIGRTGLLDRDASFNQQINAVVPGPEMLPEFLFHQLRVGTHLIRRVSTTSMKGMVSKSALQAVELLLPPISDQGRFVDLAKRADGLMRKAIRSSADLNQLLASLQQRAFRGEL